MRWFVVIALVMLAGLFLAINMMGQLPDPPMLIDEPDATSGVMPAEYNPNVAPRTVLTMCLVTKQNRPKPVEDS